MATSKDEQSKAKHFSVGDATKDRANNIAAHGAHYNADSAYAECVYAVPQPHSDCLNSRKTNLTFVSIELSDDLAR